MHNFTRIAAICGVIVVGACSEPEPEPIMVAPTYDKLGNASCPDGMVLAVDGNTGTDVCADPATI